MIEDRVAIRQVAVGCSTRPCEARGVDQERWVDADAGPFVDRHHPAASPVPAAIPSISSAFWPRLTAPSWTGPPTV